MSVYAVFREGVYRHECLGIFTNTERAIERARECAAGDGDDYHVYQVSAVALDTPVDDLGALAYECRSEYKHYGKRDDMDRIPREPKT